MPSAGSLHLSLGRSRFLMAERCKTRLWLLGWATRKITGQLNRPTITGPNATPPRLLANTTQPWIAGLLERAPQPTIRIPRMTEHPPGAQIEAWLSLSHRTNKALPNMRVIRNLDAVNEATTSRAKGTHLVNDSARVIGVINA